MREEVKKRRKLIHINIHLHGCRNFQCKMITISEIQINAYSDVNNYSHFLPVTIFMNFYFYFACNP